MAERPKDLYEFDKHDIIGSLISSLGDIRQVVGSSDDKIGFSQLSSNDYDKTKSLMMLLHFIFPHELLPALDLLDRKLLTQFKLIQQDHDREKYDISDETIPEVFYIQSASAVTERSAKRSNSRYKKAFNPINTFYEVRLDSWNCSCPAFAYSAFKMLSDETIDENTYHEQLTSANHDKSGIQNDLQIPKSHDFKFGGRITQETRSPAVCKHILAATLGKLGSNLFPNAIHIREVTIEEFAGWASGWGDGG